MSLTSELRTGGPLADWFAAQLGVTDGVHGRIAGELAARPIARPPQGTVSNRHWALVGGAVGLRLGLAVEHAPPYYCLFGAYNGGLIGWDDANGLAAAFRTHAAMAPPAAGQSDERLMWRPGPRGWIDTRLPVEHRPARPQRGSHGGLVADFTRRAARFAAAHAPPGEVGDRPTEVRLARICTVLAGWEEGYRAGRLDPATMAAADAAATGGGAGELLDAADRAVVADSAAVLELAAREGLFERLRGLAGDPGSGRALGHAGPVFVPDWADGDIVVTGAEPAAGTTLLEVKTVAGARDAATVASWLHQLVGYALIDRATGDDWRVRRVGLVFARHAHVITWGLEELLAQLSPRTVDVDELTAGFDRALRTTLRRRGLQVHPS